MISPFHAGLLSLTRRPRSQCFPQILLLTRVGNKRFKSRASTVGAVDADLASPPSTENMGIYDDIDADVLRNYQEFSLVNVIYLALRESSTSEQSARMTAMDSASKNACKIGLPGYGTQYTLLNRLGSDETVHTQHVTFLSLFF